MRQWGAPILIHREPDATWLRSRAARRVGGIGVNSRDAPMGQPSVRDSVDGSGACS